MAALAEEFGLHERQVVVALNYAAAHREEIEARVRANDRALQEAERSRRSASGCLREFPIDSMFPARAAERTRGSGGPGRSRAMRPACHSSPSHLRGATARTRASSLPGT